MTALIEGGTLASDDYQNSVIEMHDRLKRLPDSSELKQDALKAGGSLLGMGLSKRQKHSKQARLLAASSVHTLGERQAYSQ